MNTELGDFLRRRRQSLSPEDVGLLSGGRRRTPGLRREEVAMLANISVDYYERLEQGRASSPSEVLLAGLARALRLSIDELNYLFIVAGQRPPSAMSPNGFIDPALLYLLDALGTTPAQVIDDLITVVAQNVAATVLLGTWVGLPALRSNVTWRWFLDPESRARNAPAEHDSIGRGYVADLRAASALRGPDDPVASGLISELAAASEEFRDYWESLDVARLSSTRKLIMHPDAGELDLQCDVVLSPGTGHRLVIFRPQPGTDTSQRLQFLSVLGNQNFL